MVPKMSNETNDEPQEPKVQYTGFLERAFAMFVDSVIISGAVNLIFFRAENMSDIASSVAIIFYFGFWKFMDSTPGLCLVNTKIVDADTHKSPTTLQYVKRIIALWFSLIFCFISIWFVILGKRKQGPHDLIANTIVIKQ